jgi:hypothetical protein
MALTGLNLITVGLSGGEISFNETSTLGVYTATILGGDFYITDGTNSYGYAGSGILDNTSNTISLSVLSSPNYYTVTLNLTDSANMTYTTADTILSGLTLSTVGLSGGEVSFTETSTPGIYSRIMLGGSFSLIDDNSVTYGYASSGVLDNSANAIDILPLLTSPDYYTVTVNLVNKTYSSVATLLSGLTLSTVGLSGGEVSFTETSTLGVYSATMLGGSFSLIDDNSVTYGYASSGVLDNSANAIDILPLLTSPDYYTVTVDLINKTYSYVDTRFSGLTLSTVGLSGGEVSFTETSTLGVYSATMLGGSFSLIDDNSVTYGYVSSGVLDNSANAIDILPLLTSPDYYTVTVDLVNKTYSYADTLLSGLSLSTVGLSSGDISFNETSTLGVYSATMLGGSFSLIDNNSVTYGYVSSGVLDNSANAIDILPLLTSPDYYTVTINLINKTYSSVATMFSGLTLSTVGLSGGEVSFTETSTLGVYTATMLGGNFSLIDDNTVTYGYASSGALDTSANAISIPLLTSPNYYTLTVDLVNKTYSYVDTLLSGLTLSTVGLSGGEVSFTETSTLGVYSVTMLGGSFSLIDDNSVTYGFVSTGVLDNSANAIDILPLLTSPDYYTVTVNLVNNTYTSVATLLSGLTLSTVGLSGGEVSFTETSTLGVYSATMLGGNFSLIDDNSVTYGYASSGTLDTSANAISIPLLTSPNYYTLTVDLVNKTYSYIATMFSGLTLTTVGLSGGEVSFTETSTLGVYSATMLGGSFSLIDDNSVTYGFVSTGVLDNSSNAIDISPLLTSPDYYTVTVDLVNKTYSYDDTLLSGLTLSTVGLSGGEVSFTETSTLGVYSATMLGGNFSLIDNNSITYGFASTGVLDNSANEISISPLLTSPHYYTVTINLLNKTYSSVSTLSGLSLSTVGLSGGDISFNEISSTGVYSATMLGGSFSLIDNNLVTYGYASSGVLDNFANAIDILPLLTSPDYYTVTLDLLTMTYSSVATILSGLSLSTVGLSGGDISFNETSTLGVYSATMLGGSFSLIDNNSVTYGYASSGTLNNTTNTISISPLSSPNYYTVTIDLVNNTYTSVSTIFSGLTLLSVGLTGGEVSFTETSTLGVYTATMLGGSFSLIDDNSVTYGYASSGVLDNSANVIDILPLLTSPNYYTLTIDLVNKTYSSVATLLSGLTLSTVGLSGGEVSFTETSTLGVYSATMQGGSFSLIDDNSVTYGYASVGVLDNSANAIDISPLLTSPDYYTVTIDLVNKTYSSVATTVSGLSLSTVGLSSGDISFNETSTLGVYSATMLGGSFSLIDNNSVTYGYASVGVLDNSANAINISPLLTSPNYYTVTIDLVNMTYSSVATLLSGLSLSTVGLSSGDISFNETSTLGVYTATMLGGGFSLIDNNSVTYGYVSSGVLDNSANTITISPVLSGLNYYTVTVDLLNKTYSYVATLLSGLLLSTVGLSGGDVSFNQTSTLGIYTATVKGGSFSLIDNYSVTYGYESSGVLNHTTNTITISPVLTGLNFYTVTVNLTDPSNMTYSSVATMISGLSMSSVGLSGGDISFNQTSLGIYSATFKGGDFSLIDNNSVTYGFSSTGVLNNTTNTISISPILTGLNFYTVTVNLTNPSNMTYSSVATMISGLNLLIVRTSGGANVSLNETSPGVYEADFQGGNYYIADTNSNTYRAVTQYSLTGTLGYNTGSNIVFTALTQPNKYTLTVNLTNMTYSAIITIIPAPPRVPCFKEGSKILTDKGYVEVEKLRKGDLVQTSVHGFVPIHMIGYTQLEHLNNSERIKDQLYVCSKNEFPEIDEDLIITGCHSILVDDFIDNQREETEKLLSKIYVTDNKYRLPACLDKRTKVYDLVGTYNIYHIALENENYYKNYGVYANGLLVETCSKRYLKEESKMTIIE